MPDGIGISGVGGMRGVPAARAARTAPTEAAGKSFRDVFLEKIREVNGLQKEADAAMAAPAANQTKRVEDVLIAVRKAELAYKTLMQIRNRLFQVYEDINQLGV